MGGIFNINYVRCFIWGKKKIPELARGLGKGIREFKDATSNMKGEIEEGAKEEKNKI